MGERQIDPGHRGPQSILRTIGPIVLGLGILLLIVGIASFFMAFGGSGPPKYFWCAFLGMPLMFVGGVMTSYGYMGKMMRYHAQEMAPVAKDTFNYMADGTKDGIRTVASALGQGLSEGGLGLGGAAETKVRCHKCNALTEVDAKFCSACGAPQAKTKACPQCRELNDPDAKFCDNCGHRYV